MYRVHLEPFEGPLDLLLFFIRRDELDVHDIPIAQIADEFLAYVRALEEVDLDGAADFIYTAALLIQIKTRLLLPRPERPGEEDPSDPRRELVEQLLAYMRARDAAEALAVQHEARARQFTRGQASDERERLAPPPEVTVRATVFDLVAALRRALTASVPLEPDPQHAIAAEAFAVEAQRTWVLERLQSLSGGLGARGGVGFRALVEGRTRAFVIATFLAVLDLIHGQQARLLLGHTPEDFALAPRAAEASTAPSASLPRPAGEA